MSKSTSVSASRPLTKTLFQAGLQCAKRLYSEYHFPDRIPELPPTRVEMTGMGRRLTELARTAFPKGLQIPLDDDEGAVLATREALGTAAPQVLFDAAFEHGGVLVRCDILLRDKSGLIDVFEVKSGIKVKPRYVQDLALQTHVLQGSGIKVRSTFVVHLNPRYRHEGGDYPVQSLFQNTDVTDKVRQQLPRTAELVETFLGLAHDESSMELPTGTWCSHPFPCPHLVVCAEEEPSLPLRILPELTREQEQEMHLEGIESLGQIDPQRTGLTLRQRRTLQAIQRDEVELDPLVRSELSDVEYPLHFVSVLSALDVLPRYAGARPWRPTPFCWSVHVLEEGGEARHTSYAVEDAADPREALVTGLASQLGDGTIVVHEESEIEQLRPLMDDAPGAKKAIRGILNSARLVTEPLFAAGIFHPRLPGRTDLEAVGEVLLGGGVGADQEIRDIEQAIAAFRRIQTPRTRATTRSRLGEQLRQFATWRSGCLMALYRHLTSADG